MPYSNNISNNAGVYYCSIILLRMARLEAKTFKTNVDLYCRLKYKTYVMDRYSQI